LPALATAPFQERSRKTHSVDALRTGGGRCATARASTSRARRQHEPCRVSQRCTASSRCPCLTSTARPGRSVVPGVASCVTSCRHGGHLGGRSLTWAGRAAGRPSRQSRPRSRACAPVLWHRGGERPALYCRVPQPRGARNRQRGPRGTPTLMSSPHHRARAPSCGTAAASVCHNLLPPIRAWGPRQDSCR
jgi:hypothetical protein